MELSPKPIVIFTGGFGSGKTEVAINYALAGIKTGADTYLLDLDIVTPYFRVGNLREQLEKEGLHVIAAPGELASFEVPALPEEITSAIEHGSRVVIDIGGDPCGARLLSVYVDQLSTRGYEMWLVLNPFRPSGASAAALSAQAQAIEAESGLCLTGLIANPNLGQDTQIVDVLKGLDQAQECANEIRLPIVFLAVEMSLLDCLFRDKTEPPPLPPILPLMLKLHLPWED